MASWSLADLARIEDAGLNAGAQRACLQVESDHHAARAVHRRPGFADAYARHCRTRSPEAA